MITDRHNRKLKVGDFITTDFQSILQITKLCDDGIINGKLIMWINGSSNTFDFVDGRYQSVWCTDVEYISKKKVMLMKLEN